MPNSTFSFAPNGSIPGNIPNNNSNAPNAGSSAAITAPTSSFLGEPFAVWLGAVLLLIVLKFLTEEPDYKILGEGVNPAFIRIGGYNWMIIGVSAATFIIILKVIFNTFNVPGLTAFTNAL